MTRKLSKRLLHLVALAIFLAACTPAATPLSPTQSPVPVATSTTAPTDVPAQAPTQDRPTLVPPTATPTLPVAASPAATWNPRYATYLGGSGNEDGAQLITNSSGSVFIVGNTNSEDFPVTANAYDTTFNGGGADGYGGDVYAAKINPDGSGLDFATFIGGSQRENHSYFAVADEQGNIYVTGQTESDDFPVTAGAFDTDYNQNKDVFVFKLNSTGTELLYATYLGGQGTEAPLGFALDAAGNVYVAGRTNSPDFPTTENAFDTAHNGGYDTFVTKIDSSGAQLLYSTFLSGSKDDIEWGQGALAVNAQGEAYLATSSGASDAPVTEGAYDLSFNGGKWDIHLAKLDASGSALELGTYLGGSGTERVSAVELDGDGNILLFGNVQSDDFPTTADAYDPSYNGGGSEQWQGDMFLAKLDPTGAKLLYSTFLGGSQDESSVAVTLASSGDVYFAINTRSIDLFTTVSVDSKSPHPGGDDIYFGKFDPTLKQLKFGAYLGGSGADYPMGIALDAAGNLYIGGGTRSADFPVTENAFQQAYGGGSGRAFIVSLPPPTDTPMPAFTAAPTVTDIDGNLYNTVTIGTQTWMQENLKTTRYNNGDVISTTIPATLDYDSESAPKYQWAYAGDESNAAVYGRLYTWYAVTDSRNVCPAGWHVPTNAEWTILYDFLGGAVAANGKLKETGTAHWKSPNADATNESGFTGLPAGSHWQNGEFSPIGEYGHYWAADLEAPGWAYRILLTWDLSDYPYRGSADPKAGFPVRCVENRD